MEKSHHPEGDAFDAPDADPSRLPEREANHSRSPDRESAPDGGEADTAIKPRIDSAVYVFAAAPGASRAPLTGTGIAPRAWVEQFVLNLAGDEDTFNPNADLRMMLPTSQERVRC